MEQFPPPDAPSGPQPQPSTSPDVSMPRLLSFAPPSGTGLAQPTPPPPTPPAPPTLTPPATAPAGAPLTQPAMPMLVPPAGQPGMAPVTTIPLSEAAPSAKQPRRGMLVAGMAAVTIAAVAAGAFVITRGDDSDDVVVEDATELSTDLPDAQNPQDTAGFSFAAATASAQTAASVVFEMEVASPDGPMSATASYDKASGRLAMELDMSQLAEEDESFIEIGDSLSFIVDEQSQIAYVGSDFLAGFLGDIDANWISLTVDEFSVDDDVFGDVFANPLDIASVFGGLEPLDLGVETIDGELLRHYEVTIDETNIDQIDDELVSDELVTEVLASDELAVLGGDVTYGVWVDETSQIRRMKFDVVEEGQVGSVELWIDISAEPIDIALPSPADVIDMETLFGDF